MNNREPVSDWSDLELVKEKGLDSVWCIPIGDSTDERLGLTKVTIFLWRPLGMILDAFISFIVEIKF